MANALFVGREKEIESLKGLLNNQHANLVVIRGRRRIGKSRLVEEFAKGKRFYVFSGIPPVEGTDAQSQREIFGKQLGDQLSMPSLRFDDWSDIFRMLARETKEGQVVILFDEISWMGSKDPAFIGKFKNAWDLEFQKNPNLILILCGSVSTWIEKNIIKSTALYGRISYYITLDELPLSDCSQFLDLKGFRGSTYEKFKILSVTGGIPWYLQQINATLNADDNIKNLCFQRDGLLFKEYDLIFHDLFEKRSEIYRPIVETIAGGPRELNQIAEALKYPVSGTLSSYLEDLIQSGFISRDYTWSLKSGELSRLSHYRLSDNYLRFYLKYILPNKARIEKDGFSEIDLNELPGLKSILGLQFENLVIKNRKKILQKLKIKPGDVVADNPYFQRKTTKTPGCQIDYLIQTRFNTLFACEIKFSQSELKSDVISEMKDKLNRLVLPRRFACWPVLIHVNGVEETVIDKSYFTEIIDFADFLEKQ